MTYGIYSIGISLTDFPQQHRTASFFHREVVIHILLNMCALARSQSALGTCRYRICTVICMYLYIGSVIDLIIEQVVIDSDQNITAASINDVFCFVPMEMIGRLLSHFQIQQLFRIDLWVLVCHGSIAVANGNKRKTKFVKVPHAVVSDSPPQHAVSDFVLFMTNRLPQFRSIMAE